MAILALVAGLAVAVLIVARNPAWSFSSTRRRVAVGGLLAESGTSAESAAAYIGSFGPSILSEESRKI